ncbi:branched-chain alpha-keto acid dehydrogenase subunit E2 [Kineobactrum sediminis]|uniref:Dihydrolipoamide acetyltransferase component of pyruvate dehydrogenase complex n=1 Tax=Kineobactrum sediminis TaxID=1905677 RepID=A0A2N5Y3U4_9GAMM|nr:dihydrolipoamide acetyltransferase family protein [Kineobactrum sediminis]PLW83066.1 branched-chain alpha-keto acid dehydrogenase subunit E2 [Kineobactrum sediminis]
MGTFSFKLPDLGEGIVESEISKWHVAVGDTVREDQPVADVMTDKAVVEVTAPVDGVVTALACAAGEVLPVGRELIRFEVEGKGNAPAGQPAAEPAPASPPASAETAAPDRGDERGGRDQHVAETETGTDTDTDTDDNVASAQPASGPPRMDTMTPALPHRTVLTSPSVRQRAREQGIDLSLVPGSGREGRIDNRDLEAFLEAMGRLTATDQRHPRSGSRETPITGLRRIIARKMAAAKRTIPHYSYIEEIDLTQLEELRSQLNNSRTGEQPKLTLLPLIMLALARVLPDFPQCNAQFNSETEVLTEHEAIHMGIATMTKNGLLVPVVRHVEALDLWQAAGELARQTAAAREQRSAAADLQGSTITITSLGAIGGIATTPVINAPETTILGINKLQQRPMVRQGNIEVRSMMNLSASFDHRVVDGYDGAQLIQALKQLLEQPAAIFVPSFPRPGQT